MSGTAERYSRAATSSHLKMTEQPGDVDVITAAGWADSLGTILLRCRSEWDAQRAQLEHAQQNRLGQLGAAQAAHKAARAADDPAHAARDAEDLAKVAEIDMETSRRQIRLCMQSLSVAAQALRRIALDRCARREYDLSLDVVTGCVANALDIWLDRRCPSCCGRGQNGGYGHPVELCRKCRSTGERRRVFPAKLADEYTLGEWLLAQADRVVEDAQRRMSASLR